MLKVSGLGADIDGMKVQIKYTIEVDDDYRRAINLFHGRPGLASRDEVKRWVERHGSSQDDNLMFSLANEDEDDDD